MTDVTVRDSERPEGVQVEAADEEEEEEEPPALQTLHLLWVFMHLHFLFAESTCSCRCAGLHGSKLHSRS